MQHVPTVHSAVRVYNCSVRLAWLDWQACWVLLSAYLVGDSHCSYPALRPDVIIEGLAFGAANCTYAQRAAAAGLRDGARGSRLTKLGRLGSAKGNGHQERDLHRRVTRQLGHLLEDVEIPIKIRRTGEQRLVQHPTIPPQSFLKHVLDVRPDMLALDPGGRSAQLAHFWDCYRVGDPNHPVFQRRHARLDQVLPLAVYGDEGPMQLHKFQSR